MNDFSAFFAFQMVMTGAVFITAGILPARFFSAFIGEFPDYALFFKRVKMPVNSCQSDFLIRRVKLFFYFGSRNLPVVVALKIAENHIFLVCVIRNVIHNS